MRSRAGAVIALVLGGCVGPPGADPPWPGDEAARRTSRSIWAVVPEAPRKADLRPDMIRGAAVAVSNDRLLADCAATGGRAKVGVARHNKYRLAEVAAAPRGQLCVLTVAQGGLAPAAAYRSFADLRVGEPVTALASPAASEVALFRGWLAGKGDPADPFLETTLAVPATGSAVLIDRAGNLLGLGAVGPLADAALIAVPIQPALAPSLANRNLGVLGAVFAGAIDDPWGQPAPAPGAIALGEDRDSRDRAGRQVADGAAATGGPAPSRPNRGGGAPSPATGAPGPAAGPSPADRAPDPTPADAVDDGAASPPSGNYPEAGPIGRPGPTADEDRGRRGPKRDVDGDRRGRGRGGDDADDDRGRGRSGRDHGRGRDGD